MKKLFISFMIAAINLSVFAQSPEKMSFQAIIRNAGGSLVINQSVGIRISILQGTPTGTVVYQEIYNPNPVTNGNGLLSFEIGGGVPLTGTFSAIDWGTGPYYLKTETDVTGGTNYTITGTSQLLSVPYALFSKTSGNQFNNDLLVNELTIGKGNGSVASNTALGASALHNNTSGYENTATGREALYLNTTGYGNIANGVSVLRSNTTGSGNVASGFEALRNNTAGFENTATGNQALYANTTGAFNTGVGDFALRSNLIGYSNTAIGASAGFSTTGTNNVFIGAWAGYFETGSNKLYIDNTNRANESDARVKSIMYGVFDADPANQWLTINGNVGINKLNPSYRLDVTGDINFTGSLYRNGSLFGGGTDWANITNKPTTLAGYGITDAVATSGNQTITGIKTFSNDLLVNGISVGKGNGNVAANTASGYQALYSNTTGYMNTAIGNAALYSNTTGFHNEASGYRALYSNTTGYDNAANGHFALYSNTGYQNTATGSLALYANTTGYNCTAIGYQALYYNTTGSNNTSNGYGTLYSNTTGYSNVAMGVNALHNNTTRGNLVAIGDSALYHNTVAADLVSGRYNTAVGSKSMYSNTTGYGNTATGWGTLRSNTTGYYNTAYGNAALYSNTGGVSNTAFGDRTLWQNTGSFNTAVGDEALYANIGGWENTACGIGALQSNNTGSYNTAVGTEALWQNTTGTYNTAIGYHADLPSGTFFTNATAIGYNAIVNASNKVRIGNANVTVIEGQVNWSVGSDKRLKDDIEYSDRLGLEFINNLKTATFIYKNDPNKKHHDGLIAQDVKQVLEKLGLSFSGLIGSDNEEKILNLSYAEFVVPLINAVQEQQKQIESYKSQLQSLQEKVDQIEALLSKSTSK